MARILLAPVNVFLEAPGRQISLGAGKGKISGRSGEKSSGISRGMKKVGGKVSN